MEFHTNINKLSSGPNYPFNKLGDLRNALYR